MTAINMCISEHNRMYSYSDEVGTIGTDLWFSVFVCIEQVAGTRARSVRRRRSALPVRSLPLYKHAHFSLSSLLPSLFSLHTAPCSLRTSLHLTAIISSPTEHPTPTFSLVGICARQFHSSSCSAFGLGLVSNQ